MATGLTLATFEAIAARPDAVGPNLDLRNGHPVLAFEDATDRSATFAAVLPDGYSGGDLQLRLIWAAETATSGDVRWSAALEQQPAGAGFDLDTDAFDMAVAATDGVAAGAGQLAATAIILPAPISPSLAAGESYRLRISRVATDAADTTVGDVHLVALEVRED